MIFTYEETQFLTIYDRGSRADTVAEIEEMRRCLEAEETEIDRMCGVVLTKLRTMTDAEYAALDLTPDFDPAIWEGIV